MDAGESQPQLYRTGAGLRRDPEVNLVIDRSRVELEQPGTGRDGRIIMIYSLLFIVSISTGSRGYTVSYTRMNGGLGLAALVL